MCQYNDVVKEFKTGLNLNRKKKNSPLSSAVCSISPGSSISDCNGDYYWGTDFESDDCYKANELGKCVQEDHLYYEPVEGQVRLSDKQDYECSL